MKKKENKKGFGVYWIYLAIAIFFLAISFWTPGGNSKEVSYTKLEKAIKNGCVKSITIEIQSKTAKAEIDPECSEEYTGRKSTNGNPVRIQAKIPAVDEFSQVMKEAKENGTFIGEESYEERRDYTSLFLFGILPVLVFIAFLVVMNRRMGGGSGGGGVFNVGKSNAKMFDKTKSDQKVTFKDVAGLEGAKQEVEEIVHFLKNPKKYTALGGKIPKGALLVGPPGTGKTLLAKAVAGEADVPFFSMSGSEFVEMFVGVGASRVRDLFSKAKEKAPCIVFIDEIDAVGRARGKNANFNSNDERESTLNQLLTEMDGFGTNTGIIVLAATNRAEILDPALLRAGRFDRQIHVELPDLNERKEIFNVHLKPLKLDDTVDVDFLAKQTPGFSGADIANVCNEAALGAARLEKNAVGKDDFLNAVDRIVGGLEKKSKIMTAEEKRNVAFHEAGHATISWHLQFADPLVKVTIVPRGQALGAAWYLPEERQLTSQQHILDKICSLLGGRAAEEIFFGIMDTGALSDLQEATRRAYALVTYFGMSDKIRNISYYDPTGQGEYGFTKPYSETTAKLIDEEVQRIMDEQYARAKSILKEHAEGHNRVAQILIDKEVLFAEDMENVFGPRPWKSRAEELLGEDAAKELPTDESEEKTVKEIEDGL